jgi:(p)ppGpp synthase/HD superfamily hydrolase
MNNPHMTLPPWHEAAELAARKHIGQTRKDGVTPYVSHPFRVALTVSHIFGVRDDEALAVALLHDTLEDTTTDYEDLAGAFGDTIAAAVACLTDNKAMPAEARREEYHKRLVAADWRVLAVKLADAFDNVSDACRNPDRGFRSKTLRKARELVDVLAARAGERPELARALELVRQRIAALAATCG